MMALYSNGTDLRKRLSHKAAAIIKEKLFSSLNLHYSMVANSLYDISEKRVNVKITSKRKTGRYWFNIQRKNVHSYIWICYVPTQQTIEAFYWIPATEMWSYIRKNAYKDRTWERAGHPISNFEINTKKDLYIGGSKTRISIKRFRDQILT